MNQFPNDDKDLVNFLRQHRPQVPPAAANLEQQILQQVQASSVQSRRQRSPFWLVPPMIAAGLLATVVIHRSLVPAQPSAAELASLETFIENNWQGTLSEHTESYVWHFTNFSND
ncbi:hypothetical protein [Calothrix sp. PCC 7507]|uniref:hypothetical protein n=1 Tax=Calothrix sp. PCC 7507 TaxID=99598 RepID=UPI00029EC4F0|nr:hypothetical protein [Calothrix sp. PCC 7507]AFY31199.1 hypothetical protein Cal7507_0710 [Calothrix sp. PCC 7507]